MSMLGRYKKTGGFVQLLKLIETCDTAKRNNFLEMVQGEDVRWAKAIKMKMLTMDRILDWEDDQVLSRIAGGIPEDVIASLMHTYRIPISERIMPSFSLTQKERIQDMVEKGEPNEKELMRAVGTFISEVRRVLSDGSVAIEKIDKSLTIPPDIEEQLMKGTFDFPEAEIAAKGTPLNRPAPPRPGIANRPQKAKPTPVSVSSDDVESLRNQVADLKKKLSIFAYQNNRLRAELKSLQEKTAAKMPS